MRTLDRHISGRFILTLAVSLLAFNIIFIVIDLFEKIDNFIDQGVSLPVILQYYAFRIPEIALLILPVCMLLACLFSLGSHARANEFVATLAAGISMRRTLVPIVAVGLAVSIVALAAGELIAPPAADRVKSIESTELKPGQNRIAKIRANVSFIGEDGWIYWIERLDTEKNTMRNVVISRLASFMVLERIDAREAVWIDGVWTFSNGYYRTFNENRLQTEEEFDSRVFPAIVETPLDLAKIQKSSKQMSYRELSHYVKRTELSGGIVRKELVDLNLKLSYPFNNLIIVLLGAPLGALLKRGGNALGFTIALIICFIYYMTIRVGQSFGYNDVLPPLAAAWAGNILFTAIGLAIFVRFTRR